MTHRPDPHVAQRPADFDRARWKDARWSRWSFRSTADFLPTATIAPAALARPIERGASEAPQGWRPFLAETHATSALLVRNGKLVAMWPEAAADDKVPHMLFSITKSVVGLVARILIERAAIDPDRPAADIVPELAGSAFAAATLAQLLAMRDGVAFDETYADPDADIHRYSRAYWGDAAGGVAAALKALPPRALGSGFAYRTPVADVVGLMLAAATGERLAALVGDCLWRPMGAAHQAHFLLDTAGVEIAGAGLNATTGDLARLALLLLDGGRWGQRQVIPSSIVDSLFAGGDSIPFAIDLPDRPGWSYRDLWWHMGGRSIAAIGVHGQRLLIDRDSRVALIRTGAQPLPDNRPYEEANADIFTRAIRQSTPDGA